jgi:hypothetical protein
MSGQSRTWKEWLKRRLTRKKSSTKVRLDALRHQVGELSRQLEQTKLLASQGLIRDFYRQKEPLSLARTEFKVFSQFGDDGIIQYIIQRLDLPASEQRFVEFGVEDYTESNTRFLLLNNNWSGLIMDGSEEFMSSVRRSDIYWRHALTALARFITRENINALLEEAGFQGHIGILSIDIDGNEYWVWEAITVVDPAVVIVEYNGLFGAREAVTIPYQADFERTKAHHSNLYWGVSLAALCQLAAKKNYVWIGCNSAGNNAYFVRKAESDRFLLPKLPEDFVAAKFREARDPDGKLSYLGQKTGFALVKHLPVWNVTENRLCQLSDLALF